MTNKKLPPDPLAKISTSVKNNCLVFTTPADYERAVNESNPEVRARVFERLKTLKNFTSLAATPRGSERLVSGKPPLSALITDDDFRSILNPDLVVKIGNFIVKVNPATEKVYVLPATHEAQYADLVAERTSNPNIRQFSTNDDVLDLLMPDQTNQRCDESGIGERKEEFKDTLQGVDIRGTVIYRRWGIYFSLAAQIDTPKTSGTVTVDLAPVYYHVRCANTVGPYEVNGADITNNQVYQSYQGARPLNEIDFRARFHVESTNALNVTVKVDTPWIEIKANARSTSGPAPEGLSYPHNPSAYIVGQYSASPPKLTRGQATSWSITPALPSGLALDPSTGVIAGVPKEVAPAADRTVTAANADGSTTKLLHMGPVKLPIAPSKLTYPANPAIYVLDEEVMPSPPTYSGGKVTSWSVVPALPPGLALRAGDPSLGSGFIGGTPTASKAAQNYTITASNAGGSTSTVLTIEVRDLIAPITGLTYSENPASYTAGQKIATNKPSLATGVPKAGFTVIPPLPAGLTLYKSTGEIQGTPTQSQLPKTYTVTARISLARPGASVQLNIKISAKDSSK